MVSGNHVCICKKHVCNNVYIYIYIYIYIYVYIDARVSHLLPF